MTRSPLFTLLISIMFISALHSCDISGRQEAGNNEITIYRYDKLQSEFIEFNSFNAFQKMTTEYIDATKLLTENILGLGDVRDPMMGIKLRNYFCTDSILTRINKDAEDKFSDMSAYENDFGKAFGKLSKEIDGIRIPYIYTQLSGLNESIVIGDSIIGISLDKYMGSDYKLYKRFYYSYQRKYMSPERIAYDCMFYYLTNQYPFNTDQAHNLIEIMIYYGINNYAVSKLLDYDEQKIMGYSDEEMKWCKDNEKEIWKYMVSNNHLHSTDLMLIRKYLGNAPFTAFFGNESPAKVGTWLGLRIVKSYVKKHKAGIKQLLETKDYNEILIKSGYES